MSNFPGTLPDTDQGWRGYEAEAQPARIVITPHPLGSGYTVTTRAGGRTSAIPADTIQQARTFAQQLAATARGGFRIIEETRLSWPIYVPEEA